jgi:SAM-dependent methyltransferase
MTSENAAMKDAPVTRHLDLGCGGRPRNPYARDVVCGVDIAPAPVDADVEIRTANLAVQRIPFGDDEFDSVSAYDFLEHIPRVLPTADGRGTRFPFIELMNEVWRVLRPSGRFYASTPAYPHAMAFQDPTHVNILTKDSHTYFARPQLLARMYGFTGDFECVRVVQAAGGEPYEPLAPAGFIQRQRRRRRERRGWYSHIVWEFEARKPALRSANG